MSEFVNLKKQFIEPPSEFSPIPFWFWNDELSEAEIIRQIHDFHAKEVDGFVLHPRMGLPRSIPYLSQTYMELVEAAVAEAARLGMQVILYDEGMYPSGSACGMVVRHNPEFASRGLRLREIAIDQGGGAEPIAIPLAPRETLVSVQAVRKRSEGEIEGDRTLLLQSDLDRGVRFAPPDDGNWSVLFFIETPSQGTIRGVHAGQDDGEPDAPLAADLLNPEAVQAFIALTHERYYEKLSRYFGTTVLAMFTDEPDLLGRGHAEGLQPWTRGFLDEFLACGGREQDLPALWFEAGKSTAGIRETYETAVRQRMARTYYKPLADWCEAHGIGLTGHPAGSDDIGLLEHFHIPGQDVVWRYIAPEEGKALTGVHSTMGKCSSDAARHRGRRRNLNECFGVCGTSGGWTLTADNMKWYLDWLFVRGVNLISPHAFYYSIRGERRDERPPDVGPNNIWWAEYARFSRYIKRMSWLMTDSKNGAEVAVLAGAAYLPWRIAKPLYETQIEFNYLEESLLGGSCECRDGALEIAGYRYRSVLIEDGRRVAPSSWAVLESFARQGGRVFELSDPEAPTPDIGQIRVSRERDIPPALERQLENACVLAPAAEAIRISYVAKNGIGFYVIVNEGEDGYEGTLRIRQKGLAEVWRPWTGECGAASAEPLADGQTIALRVERRECLIVAVDPSREGMGEETRSKPEPPFNAASLMELSAGWRVTGGPWTGELRELSSWTEWAGMGRFSGTVTYEKSFALENSFPPAGIRLDLGVAHELVRLEVNGREAGVRMWGPYVFDVRGLLRQGTNVLRVSVTNSLANRYDGKSLPSGLIGPVHLMAAANEDQEKGE